MASNTGSKMLLVMFVLFSVIQWNRLRAINTSSNDTSIFKDIDCYTKLPPQLYFTISSLASVSDSGEITQRQLEINWYNIDTQPGDKVAIFDHDPNLSTADPLEMAPVDASNQNFYRSNVQFPTIKFDESNLTSQCLGFWGAYLKPGNAIVAVTCVRARPFWMSETRKYIGKSNLTNLLLPGTHDSGSYAPYEGMKSENVISRYMLSQDEDIFTQFCFGIRHIDLRIGHYERTPDKFWINHSVFRTNNPLIKVLNDVKRFLSIAKDEIVVLDFHRFPIGFKKTSTHSLLIDTLIRELGPLMIPNTMGYSATVDDILKTGKRILVAYDSKSRLGNVLLWPEVKQKWGDEQEVDTLYEYFSRVLNSRIPGMLWACMAELTPTSTSIFFKPKEGLRYLADKVNRNVSRWFQGEWGWKANIVATDYFLGTHVIETAIDINKRKVFCNKMENNV